MHKQHLSPPNHEITRHFTADAAGTNPADPFDSVEWGLRDALIVDHRDGSAAFEQLGVEFPTSWSVTASNIVSQKYFRGQQGDPKLQNPSSEAPEHDLAPEQGLPREHSLRQVISRVVDTIRTWGEKEDYFSSAEEASVFSDELTFLLVQQRASFNSPVWFNIGVPGAQQQAAACFILDVEDDLKSILNWYSEEGMIFKGGSGSGVNLSKIRSSKESLSRGGAPSGPVSFMRGADASAGTIKSGGTTRRAAKMVVLDDDHPDIEEFIWCKAIEERKAHALTAAGFDMSLDGADIHSIQYQNANNSVRLSDAFMEAAVQGDSWNLVARSTDEIIDTVDARQMLRQIAEAAWECADPGVQFDTSINDWNTTPNAGRIDASNPCSEHLRLANSACNLASINLLAFLDDEGEFDIDGFVQSVRVLVTAQDILVGSSDYPTEEIAKQSAQARDIGLGYTNLGASLMALGLPYDSDEGRAWAATITGILTGAAAVRSTEIAEEISPAPLFDSNSHEWSEVYGRHLEAARAVAAVELQPELNHELVSVWEQAAQRVLIHGARNAELTVAAPTGTISFMMDADTTGIEPELALVKHKRLVGGGTIESVNRTVPRALKRLGYSESEIVEISAYLETNHTILGAPNLKAEHISVFACAMAGTVEDGTLISYSGHLAMMAAIQPFLSGAMSKTVNLPEATSVEEVQDLLMDSWKKGIKCVALYRDNCKVSQPLNVGKSDDSERTLNGIGQQSGSTDTRDSLSAAIDQTNQALAIRPTRERLPRTRPSRTFEFRVADCKGFVTVGEYSDGRPGEVFIRVSKQGSTLSGIMDAFAISISHGLQYGVPLEAFVGALVGMRFEPAGMTDDPEVRIANSLVDYLFRRLALEYLPLEVRTQLGVLGTTERSQPTLPGVEEATVPDQMSGDIQPDPPTPSVEKMRGHGQPQSWHAAESVTHKPATDAPLCMSCGIAMTRAGSCFVCNECGSTSGCS